MLSTVVYLFIWLPSGTAQVFPMLTVSSSGTTLGPQPGSTPEEAHVS